MALETLKGVTEIGGYVVEHEGNCGGIVPGRFIAIDYEHNAVAFKLQNGPIAEAGVNGCQVDTLVHAAKEIIARLNAKFPCRENSLAITKLDEALHWLEARTKNRVKRGVEGASQV